MQIIVMAKAPVAGRVKTRLCPPCTPEQAAALAAAALADTLDAAIDCGADRVVLALDGEPGPWCPPGIQIIAQCTGPFDRRLAHAWEVVGAPAVQIGMDTPQVTTELLASATSALAEPDIDAVLGPAQDGGWWIIGLNPSRPIDGGLRAVFQDVPMSQPDTGASQRTRLDALGLSVQVLPTLTDVDEFDDAVLVATIAPDTRFAVTLGRMQFAQPVTTGHPHQTVPR